MSQALGLDEAPVYGYAHARQRRGRDRQLRYEQPGCWGLRGSAGLAALSHEAAQTRYADVRAIRV